MQFNNSGTTNLSKKQAAPSAPIYVDDTWEWEQAYKQAQERKAVPLLPPLYFKNHKGSHSVFRYCTKEVYEVLRTNKVPSRSHNETRCECFLSNLAMHYGTWPRDELTLHHAVGKIFDQAFVQLGPDIIEPLQEEYLTPPEVACRLLIDHPEYVEGIMLRGKLEADFPHPVTRRLFVEYVIEAFVTNGMCRPRLQNKKKAYLFAPRFKFLAALKCSQQS